MGAAAIAILIIAGSEITHQMSGSSFSQAFADSAQAADDGSVAEGVQIVNSTLNPGRYPNITVQTGIPVKWIINAPKGSINGCNYKMVMREYNLNHVFSEGENIIEFTPLKTGTISYSCWMGMIRGNIFVVDNGDSSDSGSADDNFDTGSLTNDIPSPDVPVPAGYKIPSHEFAVAQPGSDEQGNAVQEVTIRLTDNGFTPAVIVTKSGLPLLWTIGNEVSGKTAEFLAPLYSTKFTLSPDDNVLYLYPQNSFEVSTGDHRFYAYVKVVDDIGRIDEDSIKNEVDTFETLIYPDIIFESPGMNCCSGG